MLFVESCRWSSWLGGQPSSSVAVACGTVSPAKLPRGACRAATLAVVIVVVLLRSQRHILALRRSLQVALNSGIGQAEWQRTEQMCVNASGAEAHRLKRATHLVDCAQRLVQVGGTTLCCRTRCREGCANPAAATRWRASVLKQQTPAELACLAI